LWGLEWLGDWLPIVNVLQNLEVWTTWNVRDVNGERQTMTTAQKMPLGNVKQAVQKKQRVPSEWPLDWLHIVNVWPPETVQDDNTSICQASHGFLPSAANCAINARNTTQNKRTRFPLCTRAHQPHDP
jgi:hypothetical protein